MGSRQAKRDRGQVEVSEGIRRRELPDFRAREEDEELVVLRPVEANTPGGSSSSDLKRSEDESMKSTCCAGGRKPTLIESSKRTSHLCCFCSLPLFLQHNPYVHRDYRANYTWGQALQSAFQWHNETLNVWSHFLGFVLLILLLVVSMFTHLRGSALYEKVMFSIFMLGASAQMLMSALFHLFCCIDSHVYRVMASLDYSGITIMIVVSYIAPIYYMFYCFSVWAVVYFLVLLLLGGINMLANWHPTFQLPRYQVVRTMTFIGLGFSCLFMFPHSLVLNGLEYNLELLKKLILMVVFYLGGALIYATLWPERWFPGKLDNTLNSHVIWHMCVLAAAYCHYLNNLAVFSPSAAHTCPA